MGKTVELTNRNESEEMHEGKEDGMIRGMRKT